MTGLPNLTDRVALARNRAKCRSAGVGLFLHEQAAQELQERLAEVNRRFTSVAIVTGFPDFWAGIWPAATVVPDNDTLALKPGAHDLIIHGLALHWANDPVGQLIQCRRALAPDGLFLAAMFGGQTLAELRICLSEAEVRQTGGLSPRILPMAEIRDMGGLLQRAGFGLPVADSTTFTVTYAHPKALMHDLRAMGEGNALSARLRYPTRRAVFTMAEQMYSAQHATPDGRISARFEMLFLTGWAPHESQQKPLRPGSAQQRLSEALGLPANQFPDTDATGSN